LFTQLLSISSTDDDMCCVCALYLLYAVDYDMHTLFSVACCFIIWDMFKHIL